MISGIAKKNTKSTKNTNANMIVKNIDRMHRAFQWALCTGPTRKWPWSFLGVWLEPQGLKGPTNLAWALTSTPQALNGPMLVYHRAPVGPHLRKQFATVIEQHAAQNKCYKVMEGLDKHGAKTQRKTYICTSAEQDAQFGEYVFKEVYGEPVSIPTQGQLDSFATMEKVLAEEEEGGGIDDEPEEPDQEDEEEEEEDGEEEEEYHDEEEEEEEGEEEEEEQDEDEEEEEEQEEDEEEDEEEDGEADAEAMAVDIGTMPMEVDDAPTPMDVEQKTHKEIKPDYNNVLDAFKESNATVLNEFKDDSNEFADSCSGTLHTTMLLGATVSEWQKTDQLQLAAAKAEHKCNAEVATRVFVRAANTVATDVAEDLKGIGHYEPLPWPAPRGHIAEASGTKRPNTDPTTQGTPNAAIVEDLLGMPHDMWGKGVARVWKRAGVCITLAQMQFHYFGHTS